MTPHLKRNSVLGGLVWGRAGVPGDREGTWRKDAGPSRLSACPIRGEGGSAPGPTQMHRRPMGRTLELGARRM